MSANANRLATNRIALYAGLTITAVATPFTAFALPSLDPRHAISTPVPQEGVYTVIRDHEDPLRWYVMPNQPALAERMEGGKPVPEFSLLRYTFEDPAKAGAIINGGILQFASVMDLPGATGLTRIRQAAARALAADTAVKTELGRAPSAADITLSAMPFTKANVAIYLPGSGDKAPLTLVGGGSRTSGIAPQFATQSMPFTVELRREGADVYEALTGGEAGGVQVIYDVDYTGVTPDVGFTVKVNWSKVYDHTSSDVKNRDSFAGNFFGADVEAAFGINAKRTMDYLEANGMVEIDVTKGQGMTEDELKTMMGPIIEQIRAKAFKGDQLFPDQLKRATAADAKDTSIADVKMGDLREGQKPTAGDKTGTSGTKTEGEGGKTEGEGTSAAATEPDTESDGGKVVPTLIPTFRTETNVALNSEYMKTEGEETFSYAAREIVDRSTVVGGFLGVGGYIADDESLRDRLIRDIGPSDKWSESFLTLPAVGAELIPLGVTRVTVEAALVDATGAQVPGVAQQAAVYDPTETTPAWKVGGGVIGTGRLAFPLAGVKARLKASAGADWRDAWNALRFKVTQTIVQKGVNQPIRVVYETPITNGAVDMASAQEKVGVVQIRSALKSLGEADGVESVLLRLRDSQGRNQEAELDKDHKVAKLLLPLDGASGEATYDLDLMFILANGDLVPASGDFAKYEGQSKTTVILNQAVLDKLAAQQTN